MPINHHALFRSLAHTLDSLPMLIDEIMEPDLRWKPAANEWSILEILCHLADEEVEDFRVRLRLTLENPAQEWPPIDPAGWVTARNYAGRDPRAEMARFLQERRASLAWLHALPETDWSRGQAHPKLGTLRAGDLLLSWAAHDLLHMRQMLKRRYQLLARHGGEYSAEYAGPG